jgi:hypothetical protein
MFNDRIISTGLWPLRSADQNVLHFMREQKEKREGTHLALLKLSNTRYEI